MPASREKKRKTTQAQAFLLSTSDPLSTVVWTLRDVLRQLDVAGRTTNVCPVEERARRMKETGEAIKEARRSVEAVLAVATHLTATVIPRTAAALGGGEQVGVYRALNPTPPQPEDAAEARTRLAQGLSLSVAQPLATPKRARHQPTTTAEQAAERAARQKMMRRFPVPAGSTKYTPAEVVQFFGRLRDDNEDKHFIKEAREYVLDVRRFVPFASDRAFRKFLAMHVFAASPQPAPSRWMTKGRPRLVSIEGCKVFAETRSKNTSAPLNTAVASAFIQEEMQKAQEATNGGQGIFDGASAFSSYPATFNLCRCLRITTLAPHAL